MPKKENFCYEYYCKSYTFVRVLQSSRVNADTLLTTVICFVNAQQVCKFQFHNSEINWLLYYANLNKLK